MRIRTLASIGCAMHVLAGCSRVSDSQWNPLGWFGGGSSEPTTLAPEGGYPTASQDGRQPLARVISAKWEPLYEGRLLTVTGLAATKGWWDVELISEVAMPRGRIRADENGVLRLRLVGTPPNPETFAAANAAKPASDTSTVGMTLSTAAMSNLREVVISGAGNAISLRP